LLPLPLFNVLLILSFSLVFAPLLLQNCYFLSFSYPVTPSPFVPSISSSFTTLLYLSFFLLLSLHFAQFRLSFYFYLSSLLLNIRGHRIFSCSTSLLSLQSLFLVLYPLPLFFSIAQESSPLIFSLALLPDYSQFHFQLILLLASPPFILMVFFSHPHFISLRTHSLQFLGYSSILFPHILHLDLKSGNRINNFQQHQFFNVRK
jgi:hypothetical protein